MMADPCTASLLLLKRLTGKVQTQSKKELWALGAEAVVTVRGRI